MRWCDREDLRRRCATIDTFLERVPGCSETPFIEEASGEAASYMERYHDQFYTWEDAAGPAEIRGHVAAIAVYRITAASGTISERDLRESVWSRGYVRAIEWLRDLQRGCADLNMDWVAIAQRVGHRAVMSIRTRPADF